jgi:hypothetical protein
VVESGSITLALVQPSARRREWQLDGGGDVLARLWIPPLRPGARAEVAGEQLRIRRAGRLHADYVVRDESTGEAVARLRREGRRLLLDQDGSTAEWKRIGRKEGYGFVRPDGAPFVRAKLRSGLVRHSAEVEIAAAAKTQDALVAAVLASYLLIRKHEAESASAGTTAVVVTS